MGTGASYELAIDAPPCLLRRAVRTVLLCKYFSIADDSGPWLCGETCIRDSFYPIFHIFEKNLTKATSNTVCADAGYTKYNSTVTHGGGGLYCTLDLYECAAGSGKCPHPAARFS